MVLGDLIGRTCACAIFIGAISRHSRVSMLDQGGVILRAALWALGLGGCFLLVRESFELHWVRLSIAGGIGVAALVAYSRFASQDQAETVAP